VPKIQMGQIGIFATPILRKCVERVINDKQVFSFGISYTPEHVSWNIFERVKITLYFHHIGMFHNPFIGPARRGIMQTKCSNYFVFDAHETIIATLVQDSCPNSNTALPTLSGS